MGWDNEEVSEEAEESEYQEDHHLLAYAGHGASWHAECSSPCLTRGMATDHSSALVQGGQHLSSWHFGESEGIHIRQDQHGQYYWECLAACGYIGDPRQDKEDADSDADDHRSQHPRHQAYVEVVQEDEHAA